MRSKSTFVAFRSSRIRASAGPVRIAFAGGSDRPCVAFAINRKVGGAVVRNRLRRRLRGIVQELSGDFVNGAYLIGISRGAVTLPYGELKADVKAALDKLKVRIAS